MNNSHKGILDRHMAQTACKIMTQDLEYCDLLSKPHLLTIKDHQKRIDFINFELLIPPTTACYNKNTITMTDNLSNSSSQITTQGTISLEPLNLHFH
jgi:hypothetical protein